MYISHHMINISVINHKLTQFTAHKFFSCIVNTHTDIYPFNFFSWNQTFPHFYFGQGERSFKKICIQFLLRFIRFARLLKKITQISLCKKIFAFINTNIKNIFEYPFGNARKENRNGIK